MKNERYTEEVEVTPKLAAEWLLRLSSRQRKVSKNAVETYSREMKEGYWQLNGESIKFDYNGALIDGQHRLKACVKADVPFKTKVDHGLDPIVFETLDTGKNRSAKDVFSMMGVTTPANLAAAVRMTYSYKRLPYGDTIVNGSTKMRASNHDLRVFYEEDVAGWEDTIKATLKTEYHMVMKLLAPGAFGFLWHLFYQVDRENCLKFFHTMATGIPCLKFENKALNCPVWAAREKLIQVKMDVGRMAQSRWLNHAKIAICLTAWNALVDGKGITVFSKAEAKPWPAIKNEPYRDSKNKVKRAVNHVKIVKDANKTSKQKELAV